MILFKRQRLLQVLLKQERNFVSISLRIAFMQLFKIAAEQKFTDITVFLGKSHDVESVFSLKLWSRNWFKKTYFLQDYLEDSQAVRQLFRHKASIFFSADTFKNAAYIFLLGLNLRYESPYA
jgi:hypothetical protein